MRTSSWRRPVVIAGLALVSTLAHAAGEEGPPVTPAPQPAIGVIIGRDLTPVRDLFNRLADRPRLLILVSPT